MSVLNQDESNPLSPNKHHHHHHHYGVDEG